MHNVILIATRHEAIGQCNADELCKIIERIKREHTMLQNIYNYSSAHCYAQAVFLVGK
jgi:hypothetical protein